MGIQMRILSTISLLALVAPLRPAYATDDPAAPNHPVARMWNSANQISPPDETNSCTKSMGVLAKKLNTPIGDLGGKSYDFCLGGNIAQSLAQKIEYSRGYMEIVSLKSYHSKVSDRMAAVQASLKADGGNICGAPAPVKASVASLDSYLQCTTAGVCEIKQAKDAVAQISEQKKLWIKYAQQGLAGDLNAKDVSTKISCRNVGSGAKQIVTLFERSEKTCAQMLDYMNKTKAEVSQLNASLGGGCNK
jgi:hypothetical protein